MEISYLQVKKIFDTLPVGYYIGRDVQRELSNSSETSFYDSMNDKIVVSYPFVAEGLKGTTEDKVENDIRTLLYHETSHVFLTPKHLMFIFERDWGIYYCREITPNEVINIFEDERIERMFDKFYMGVNFKEYCKRVNHWTGKSKAKNIREAWFDFIRFRTTTPDCISLLPDIDIIIKKYVSVTAETGKFDVELKNYCNAVIYLFQDFLKRWDKDDVSESKSSDTDEVENKFEEISEKDFNLEKIESDKTESTCDDKFKNDIISKVNLKDIISKTTEKFIDNEMIETFKQLFAKNAKITKMNSSAINTYSGIFNPRSVVRDDYKFFLQSNRIGHQKAYSKMKLNLFIDGSGSFGSSVNTVNKIIYALQKIEKINPNFEFDVVTVGMDEQLLPKNKREFDAHGGNAITPKMTSIYNLLQTPQSQVINILLFDGACDTDCNSSDCRHLTCFNNNKSIIISDASNKDIFNKYIPSVKVKYCTNFTEELYKSIITALQTMLR